MGKNRSYVPGEWPKSWRGWTSVPEVNPSDTRHLFREEMKRLFSAMREVVPEDLDDATMSEFLATMDAVWNVHYCVEKRR